MVTKCVFFLHFLVINQKKITFTLILTYLYTYLITHSLYEEMLLNNLKILFHKISHRTENNFLGLSILNSLPYLIKKTNSLKIESLSQTLFMLLVFVCNDILTSTSTFTLQLLTSFLFAFSFLLMIIFKFNKFVFFRFLYSFLWFIFIAK